MSERKLNIGCGLAVLPGFDNIDNSPAVFLSRYPALKWLAYRCRVMSKQQYETVWPKDVIWADAARGLSYVAGSVAKIYSSHFLEHVREKVAVRVLQECRRVLAPGGVFRLVVPDLQYYARRYVAETDALIAANEATRKSRDDFLYMACGGYLHRGRSGAHHMFMYDWPSMKLLLTELGYKDVQRCGFQQSRDAELAKLDNRPEDSLHVEMTV